MDKGIVKTEMAIQVAAEFFEAELCLKAFNDRQVGTGYESIVPNKILMDAQNDGRRIFLPTYLIPTGNCVANDSFIHEIFHFALLMVER